MFQFQALTRSDSTLVPCLWCCLYITFSSAHPSPKAHLVYFFYVTGLCPCTRPPPNPPTSVPRTSTLVLSGTLLPEVGRGNNVAAPLSPTSCPVSVCLTVLTPQTAH